MRTIQRIEAVTGLIAGLLGLVLLAYVLFGPSYQFLSSPDGGSGRASLLQAGISPLAIVSLSLLALVLLGIMFGSVQHSRTAASGWRWLLVCSVLLLVILNILSLPSIGLWLIPVTLLALLTLGLSLTRARQAA